MASVDILHPLAEDTIANTGVQVMVAYDLRGRFKETMVDLVCKMSGPSSASLTVQIPTDRPGDHPFDFGTLASGEYSVSAKAMDVSDEEAPVLLVDSMQPLVTIDPPAVPPPAIIPTTGSYANFEPRDFEVRVYGLVPESWNFINLLLSRWRLLKRQLGIGRTATSRSKKPFDRKFKQLSAWGPVSAAGGIWIARIPREIHDKHLMIRAKVQTGNKEQSSRGSRIS